MRVPCFESSKGELYALCCASQDVMSSAWHLRNLHTEHAVALTRFRLVNHFLPIETGRWDHTPREERLCQSCGVLGAEYHHLFDCALYDDLCDNIRPLLDMFKNMDPLRATAELLTMKDKRAMYHIAKYVQLAEARSNPSDTDTND